MELSFTKAGWSEPAKVNGVVTNESGEELFSVGGCWHESISITNLRTQKSEVIWRLEDHIVWPEKKECQYEFTQFVLRLNHLPESLNVK